MSAIAIASGDVFDQTFNLLRSIYKNTPDTVCPIITLTNCSEDKNSDTGVDILILGFDQKLHQSSTDLLRNGGFLLINSDDKPAGRQLRLKSATPISYGFNKKSCVTASSVIDGEYKTMQCCVQRPIPTLSGKSAIEQEFSIKVKSTDVNNYSVLAAVTAALINDFPPKAFSGMVYPFALAN